MDSFLEYLVKKKCTGKDIAIRIGIIAAAVLVSMIVFLLFMAVEFLRSFSFFAVLCVGYGAYLLITRMDIEYEYIFTNGELDIDVIRGKKFRKRMVSIECKNIRIMEKAENVVSKNSNGDKNICAVYNLANGGIYKVEVINEGGGKDKVIYFQPPENLVKEMKKYNPRNIITE